MNMYKVKSSPDELSKDWDLIAPAYFLQTAFLKHVHQYNYCNQRYYEMFDNGRLVAFTIVYTLPINLFTFSGLKLTLKMNVLGIPVSIATEPVAGDCDNVNGLLKYILNREKGLILGLNLTKDYHDKRIINLRTLPTVVYKNQFENFQTYSKHLRSSYRRKIRLNQNRFDGVETKETSCDYFSTEHYELYEAIMSRTRTKLEKLTMEFFQNLPEQFILTSHYMGSKILCWNICVADRQTFYFFFGGMNYKFRDKFRSYHNNLLSILKLALRNRYQTIDFGQTAELAKLRLGGSLSERRMFIFHHNRLIRFILGMVKGFINYRTVTKIPNVFRKSDLHDENNFDTTEAVSSDDWITARNDR